MRLITTFIFLYLFSLCIFVCADLDQELRDSIDIAMKCQYREPPKGPVIAATPSRFAQIVVILHERFKTPSCFKTSKRAVSVSDETTWPFCIFGRCNKGRCECGGHFSGSKCHIYKKKCWLMYCYLTSCLPSHQSLHCICDPSLYGTEIKSGFYWYDEGKSSKFVPPPAGWEDEPTGMIKLKSDAGISMGAKGPAAGANSAQSSRGSKTQSQVTNTKLGGFRNQGSLSSAWRANQETASRQQVTGTKPEFQSGDLSSLSRGYGGEDEGVTKKNDVEEALEELEEVSSRRQVTGKKPGFQSGALSSRSRGYGREDEGVTKKNDVEEALEELEETSSAPMLRAKYNLILITIYFLWICMIYLSVQQ